MAELPNPVCPTPTRGVSHTRAHRVPHPVRRERGTHLVPAWDTPRLSVGHTRSECGTRPEYTESDLEVSRG